MENNPFSNSNNSSETGGFQGWKTIFTNTFTITAKRKPTQKEMDEAWKKELELRIQNADKALKGRQTNPRTSAPPQEPKQRQNAPDTSNPAPTEGGYPAWKKWYESTHPDRSTIDSDWTAELNRRRNSVPRRETSTPPQRPSTTTQEKIHTPGTAEALLAEASDELLSLLTSDKNRDVKINDLLKLFLRVHPDKHGKESNEMQQRFLELTQIATELLEYYKKPSNDDKVLKRMKALPGRLETFKKNISSL